MHIHIIGLGVTQTAVLDAAATAALKNAARVIGSPRQLATLKDLCSAQQCLQLPPLSQLPQLLSQLQQELQVQELQGESLASIAVLASGDPLFYGIGRWFARHYNRGQISYYPAVSSIQAACHLLGLSLQDVDVVSLHGRPREKIRRQLKKNRTLVILTDKHSSPQTLAQECLAAGFAQSVLSVCEALGYQHQQVRQFKARELLTATTVFDPLHITVIAVKGEGGILPEFPGIADNAFVTSIDSKTDAGDKVAIDKKTPMNNSAMLSKREVRLVILSLLQVAADDVVWDIGAGCGGVAVELAYWHERTQILAIEQHPQRCQCLHANRQKFGVLDNLTVIEGSAPHVFPQLPNPDKVFIGGSDGNLSLLLDQVWQRLPLAGALVASAVTESSRQQLITFYQQHINKGEATGETLQVAICKGDALAGQLLYRPKLPVTLLRLQKQSPVKP